MAHRNRSVPRLQQAGAAESPARWHAQPAAFYALVFVLVNASHLALRFPVIALAPCIAFMILYRLPAPAEA